MDPKELAKLYEKNGAAAAAEAGEKKAQMDAQQAEFQNGRQYNVELPVRAWGRKAEKFYKGVRF